MPHLTLTLDGHPVDLPADAQVALSYRVNDVRTLDSREAAFSETFTLPPTANNRAVLGSPHSLDSLTTAPYRLLPAVLTSPGGTVLLRGFGILGTAGPDGYEVILTDAAGALFATVGSRKLRELNLTAYDHPLTYAALQAADGYTYANGGYTYAAADIGVLIARPELFVVTPDELPAAVFVHTLLVAMLTDPLPPVPLPDDYQVPDNPLAKYRLTGSLLTDPLYQATVLPRATAYPQLREQYLEPYRTSVRTTQTTTYTQGATLTWPRLVRGTALEQNQRYLPPPHPVGLKVSLRLPVTLAGRDAQLFLVQQEGGSATSVAAWTLTDSGTVSLQAELPVAAFTAQSRLQLVLVPSTAPGFPNAVTIGAGASLEVEVLPRSWPGAPVHLDAALPALSQADLLKWLLTAFNVIVQVDPVLRLLRLDLSNDLERNRAQAVDWTSRLDLTRAPRLAYRLPDYAQANVLRYAAPAEQVVEELLPVAAVGTGRGVLRVTDATLPATREAFTTDLQLPLPHATGPGQQALTWLPLLNPPDAPIGPPLYDSQKTYQNADLVLYKGQLWVYASGPFGPGSAPPPWGDNNIDPTGSPWQRPGTGAYVTVNAELPTVARLVPAGANTVQVADHGLHAGTYTPARALSREGLGFDELLLAYWPGFARCCERLALLTVDLRLTGLDISGLDFTVPRRIGPIDIPHYGRLSVLGYLNLIDQWVPGQPGAVPVELLVLGAPIAGLAPAVPLPIRQVLSAFVLEDNTYYLLDEQGRYLLPE